MMVPDMHQACIEDAAQGTVTRVECVHSPGGRSGDGGRGASPSAASSDRPLGGQKGVIREVRSPDRPELPPPGLERGDHNSINGSVAGPPAPGVSDAVEGLRHPGSPVLKKAAPGHRLVLVPGSFEGEVQVPARIQGGVQGGAAGTVVT